MKISFGRRSRRRITMMGLGVFAVAALALPSLGGADKPTPSATATATSTDPFLCEVVASYQWSAFPKAREWHLDVRNQDGTLSGEREGTAKRSGMASFTANISSATDSYHADGWLTDKAGHLITGSADTSDPVSVPNCS